LLGCFRKLGEVAKVAIAQGLGFAGLVQRFGGVLPDAFVHVIAARFQIEHYQGLDYQTLDSIYNVALERRNVAFVLRPSSFVFPTYSNRPLDCPAPYKDGDAAEQ
jgi:hypothetical protein